MNKSKEKKWTDGVSNEKFLTGIKKNRTRLDTIKKT